MVIQDDWMMKWGRIVGYVWLMKDIFGWRFRMGVGESVASYLSKTTSNNTCWPPNIEVYHTTHTMILSTAGNKNLRESAGGIGSNLPADLRLALFWAHHFELHPWPMAGRRWSDISKIEWEKRLVS